MTILTTDELVTQIKNKMSIAATEMFSNYTPAFIGPFALNKIDIDGDSSEEYVCASYKSKEFPNIEIFIRLAINGYENDKIYAYVVDNYEGDELAVECFNSTDFSPLENKWKHLWNTKE